MERLTKYYPLGVFKADCTISWRELCEKLAHYEDLEEQGLLLKLPCKVGDKVYCLWCEGKICEAICKAFQVDEENKLVWIEGEDFEFYVSFERFGKTIFCTKEEAEAKLKEMQNE